MTDNSRVQASETPVPSGQTPIPQLAAGQALGPATLECARRIPWYGIALALVLALSAWFRLSNLGYASLTHDEAWRANICYGVDPVLTPRRLPPLQFAMGRLIQNLCGRTELWVRLPYALAGVGCVIFAYLFARRHFDRGSALLAAAVVGSNPELVAFSRKAKVFSLEALMAVLVLWAGFEAYRRRSSGALLVFMVAGTLAVGFTFSASLMVAAWMPLLAYAVLGAPFLAQQGVGDSAIPHPCYRRDGTRPHGRPLRTFLVVTAVLALVGGAWYFWLSGSPIGNVAREHPAFNDAWPASFAPAAFGSWLLAKADGVLRFTLGTSGVWEPLRWYVGVAGFLAIAASSGVLWRRQRVLCAFFAILAAGVVSAAALRLWPIGELRTMTFLIPLFGIAIGCGLYQFVRHLGRSPATVVILVFCVLVPTVRATKATLFPPPLEQHTRPVFAYTAAHLQPGDALFIHYEMKDAYRFYWRDTDHPTLLQPHDCRDDVGAFAARFDPWIAEHPRVWFVFMLRRPAEIEAWRDHLEQHYRVCDEYRFNDAAVYLVAPSTGRDPALQPVGRRGVRG